MPELTHVDDLGRAKMVDVGEKRIQKRTAIAQGFIELQESTLELIKQNNIKKGDVLSVAVLSGIMAAKKTSELIPLCHPLQLTSIDILPEFQEDGILITSRVSCNGKTGVEMEALTAVNVALLAIYDMCKASDKQMKLKDIELVKKTKEE